MNPNPLLLSHDNANQYLCQNHVHPEPRVSCKSHAQLKNRTMMRFFSIFKNHIKMRFISTQCNSPRIPMPTVNYLLSSKLALHFNSVVHIVYSLASNLANLVTLYFLCALVPVIPALNSALVSLDPPKDAQKPSSGTEPDNARGSDSCT